jgi:hypothetical protein
MRVCASKKRAKHLRIEREILRFESEREKKNQRLMGGRRRRRRK